MQQVYLGKMSQQISSEDISVKITNKIKNTCDKCKKKFLSLSQLRRHERSHNELKKFQCNLCQKLFKLKSSLKRHTLHNHENIKRHKCSKCYASFAQRINLVIHQKRLHIKRTSFKCNECNCFFKRLNMLNRHKKEQHTEKPNISTSLFGDDPNLLAELVVTQLKSLEQGISSVQTQQPVTAATFDNPEDPLKTTLEERAEFGEASIKVKLNPARICQTIKAQTVKRPKELLAYVCEYCSKEFHKTYNFIRHLRSHTKERPYGCTICSSNFMTKTRLESHFKRMHILNEATGFLSNQHKCVVCNLKFSSMRKLDLHMKVHTENYCVQYYCTACQHKFCSKTAFSSHRHKIEDIELTMLKKLLPEPKALPLAVETPKLNNDNKIFTCPQQDLYKHQKQHEISSCSSNILRTHQKLPKSEKDFTCSICCKREFPTKFQLERHKRHVHHVERNFECCYCPQRFKTSTHCKSHMKTHLKNLLGTFQENTNDQPTISTAQVIVQEKNSTCNTPKFIQIEQVPKDPKFKHRNIQVEVASNSSPKTKPSKHKCLDCSKEFQKPSDLLRHTRLHTQERPFFCDICKKTFKLKSTLDDHYKTHLSSPERCKTNISCQVCGKSYATQKSLNVHLRLHTGEFPFRCEFCGQPFRTSGHRLAHLKTKKSKNGNCINISFT